MSADFPDGKTIRTALTMAVRAPSVHKGLRAAQSPSPLEIKEIRDEVGADVFGTSGYPQMLLRIGWAPINSKPLPATPRRPLSDAVNFLDGNVLNWTASF